MMATIAIFAAWLKFGDWRQLRRGRDEFRLWPADAAGEPIDHAGVAHRSLQRATAAATIELERRTKLASMDIGWGTGRHQWPVRTVTR